MNLYLVQLVGALPNRTLSEADFYVYKQEASWGPEDIHHSTFLIEEKTTDYSK